VNFRSDGWPLCPSCVDDELWSPLIKRDDFGVPRTPTLAEYLEADDFRCYACNWRGSLERSET
jgi:hypothetical protein